jgi:uncharacterized membrane protein
MKKSTLLAITFMAVFITTGWYWIKSFGIWLLAAAAVSATIALISAFRKVKS